VVITTINGEYTGYLGDGGAHYDGVSGYTNAQFNLFNLTPASGVPALTVGDVITSLKVMAWGYSFAITVDNVDLVLTAAVKIPGDANGDGMVDVGDLGILAANYGGSGKTWALGDFNGDGLVDVGDLGILAANYGTNASNANWAADYAKVFSATVADDNSAAADEEETAGTVCSALGLPLIAGLMLMGLMLVKLEE
jgi:hypothetical protein